IAPELDLKTEVRIIADGWPRIGIRGRAVVRQRIGNGVTDREGTRKKRIDRCNDPVKVNRDWRRNCQISPADQQSYSAESGQESLHRRTPLTGTSATRCQSRLAIVVPIRCT